MFCISREWPARLLQIPFRPLALPQLGRRSDKMDVCLQAGLLGGHGAVLSGGRVLSFSSAQQAGKVVETFAIYYHQDEVIRLDLRPEILEF